MLGEKIAELVSFIGEDKAEALSVHSAIESDFHVCHLKRKCLGFYMQSQCAYLTGGLPLAVGDFVVVPVGNRNAEKTGRVTDVFVCSAQDAPYPPEKTKFVLRKSEQTAFPEKKTTPVEPAKNEKAAAPMPPVPVEPPAVQSAPEKPASFEVEPVPEDPTFTLPPPSEQDEPKKPKRRIPWGWPAAAVAVIAFFVFALPPLKRTAEANRQMVIAQQAAEREKREQEERRAEQARLEEEAAAQRRREEKQARIEALQNADLPYPGMPYEELTSTKLGKASKVTHEMRSGQVYYTFVWQIRVGDYLYPVFEVMAENENVLTAEQRNLEYWSGMALKGTIYHQPEYKPSTPSQNQTGGTNHGSSGLRDEYDNPEDLYEDTAHRVGQGKGQLVRLGVAQADGQAALRVPVDQQHFLSGLRQPNPQVRAGGCLANAAFLVGDGDDLRVQ